LRSAASACVEKPGEKTNNIASVVAKNSGERRNGGREEMGRYAPEGENS
jgi:ribosomal protein S16